MKTIQNLAKYLKPYMDITDLDEPNTYTYKARCGTAWPVVNNNMHRPKISKGSILYAAIDAEADLDNLKPEDLLYIGSQKNSDRMFRGDGLAGKNFHHLSMRKGCDGNNLTQFLSTGRKVKIYYIDENSLMEYVKKEIPDPCSVLNLKKDHPGFILEQIVLVEGQKSWSWNSAGPHKSISSAL